VIRVYVSSVADASADTVWSRIRDFTGRRNGTRVLYGDREPREAPRRLHPPHTRDGGTIRERLRFSATTTPSEILESSMGVENHVSTLSSRR
jgi:hypothetical protein